MTKATHKVTFKDKELTFNVRPNTKDDRVIDEIFDQGVYLKKKYKFDVLPGEHWVDLGAHIGAFSVYAAVKGATVTAYEPHVDNFALLKANVKKYKVTPVEGVVSSTRRAFETLYKPSRTRGGEVLNTKFMINGTNSYIEVGKVPNYYFGSVLKGGAVGVKMDIEGAEQDILDDLPKIPSTVKKLCLEYHFIKDRSLPAFKRRMDALREQFTTVGYPKHLDEMLNQGLDKYPGFFDRMIFCVR